MLGLPVLDEASEVADEGPHLPAGVRRLLREAAEAFPQQTFPLQRLLWGFPERCRSSAGTRRRTNPLCCFNRSEENLFFFFFSQQPRRLVFALHLQAVYSPVLHTSVEVRCLLTLKDTRSETETCMKIKMSNRTSASKRTGLMKASTNSCVRGECTDVYMLLH